MANILWLRKVEPEDSPIVGKKVQDLNALFVDGFNIPPGFILTKYAYEKFFSQISHRVKSLLDSIDLDNPILVKKIASEIQKMILDTPLPQEIDREIEEAYESMNVDTSYSHKLKAFDFLKSGMHSEVAVRMSPISANKELLKNSEFASFLNVTGVEQIKRAAKACWASLFSSNNIIYRTKNKISQDSLNTSIIIQKMIKADKSGSLYSKNPENSKDEIVIRSCWGLGRTLREVEGNYFVLEPERNRILKSEIKPQAWAYYGGAQGKITKQELSYNKVNSQVLTTKDLISLGNICRNVKNDINYPFRLDFAIDGEEIFILKMEGMEDLTAPSEVKEDFKEEKVDVISKEMNTQDMLEELDKEEKADQVVYGGSSPFGNLVREIPVKSLKERLREVQGEPKVEEKEEGTQEKQIKDEDNNRNERTIESSNNSENKVDEVNNNLEEKEAEKVDINNLIENGNQEEKAKDFDMINSAYEEYEKENEEKKEGSQEEMKNQDFSNT